MCNELHLGRGIYRGIGDAICDFLHFSNLTTDSTRGATWTNRNPSPCTRPTLSPVGLLLEFSGNEIEK